MNALDIQWAQAVDLTEIASPALLISVETVRRNIREMLRLAGDASRLRPHVKTHKQPWIIEEHLSAGITRFKCATIAEAEMCARANAPDVLLAVQPVGPNVSRFFALRKRFPKTRFLTLADHADAIAALGKAAVDAPVEVLLDIDVGQHRTGVTAGLSAVRLYQLLASTSNVQAAGLHAYDGHLHQPDPAERAAACENAFRPVAEFRDELRKLGLPVPRVVAGGTPTFPMHAKRGDVECSPGTCVLWDAGYATNLPDLHFACAAVLLGRVISKPEGNRVCVDLGHKAVASEMPQPRVIFPDMADAEVLAHNEEHMVLRTSAAVRLNIGDAVLGVPWHICPTVALHAEAVLVEQGEAGSPQAIEARARRLTI